MDARFSIKLATLMVMGAVVAYAGTEPNVAAPGADQSNGVEFRAEVGIPAVVRDAFAGTVRSSGLPVEGRVTTNGFEMAVAIEWSWTGSSGQVKRHEQTFPLAFYPTGVLPLPDGQMVVAGVREDGSSTVEAWTIELPSVLPGTVLTSSGSSTGGASGKFVATVSSKKVVHTSGPELADGVIYNLLPHPSKKAAFLYQRSDVRHLFQLDTRGAAQPTLIASSEAVEGFEGPVISELKGDFDRLVWGFHPAHGAVYHLSNPAFVQSDFVPSTMLRLVDTNRDGVLDSHAVFHDDPYPTDALEYEWMHRGSYTRLMVTDW